MKILLIGLGSIGKRHLQNIIELGYTDINIVSSKDRLPEAFSRYKQYSSLDEALKTNVYKAAIVCVPTAYHLKYLQQLIQAKIPSVYLEKPVSHTYDNVQEIVRLSTENNTHIVVGFDMHYDVGLQKANELLSRNTIGKLISVNAQVGQYLPDWRPEEDYRKGMSARKESGGGVMLDLVHEFDYLYWLIGSVDTIASINKNSGVLGIETEDVAEVMLKFSNGVIGTVHLDYLQQKLVRNCMFTGSEGTIFWNLGERKVTWVNKMKETNEFSYQDFERNDRFVAIMKNFLENTKDDRLTNLHDGLESLKMVMAAKYSSIHNVFVQMKTFNP